MQSLFNADVQAFPVFLCHGIPFAPVLNAIAKFHRDTKGDNFRVPAIYIVAIL